MRITTLLIFLTATVCTAQSGEFTIHSNGFIYDEATMDRLGHIVDSLNLKFKTCELIQPYVTLQQGRGTFVEITKKRQLKMIRSGATLEAYLKKYPKSVVRKDLWVSKSQYLNDGEIVYTYRGLSSGAYLYARGSSGNKSSGWVIGDYDQDAYYLHGLEARPLPEYYSRLAQYVDCMTDSTTNIYLDSAKNERYYKPDDTSPIGKFLAWADSYPGRPAIPDNPSHPKSDSIREAFYVQYPIWDSLRLLYVDAQLKTSANARQLLANARDEAFTKTESTEQLERFAMWHLSASDMLQLKRSRIVRGFCSMDDGPRVHAVEICILAARTAQWDVFLRSHLNVMNDNFDRNSDGTYAWGARKTYLKELEALEINTLDLLFGSLLGVSNAGKHHYEGSGYRIGRALTEAADKDEVEKRLEVMITDNTLDLYNRKTMYDLYRSYTRYLPDPDRKSACIKKLQQLEAGLPEDLKTAIALERR